MGQKCHPIGMRLGIIKDWQSRWYASPRAYADNVMEDHRIRRYVMQRFGREAMQQQPASGGRGGRGGAREVGLARVEIERAANTMRLTLFTAKPGLIIGRGGRGVDELRAELESLTERRMHITVQEIREPNLDAQLVAESIAAQIERRVAFKRAVRQAIQRTMREGARGIRVIVGGRLAGAEIARSYRDYDGKIPLQTLRADIDYGFAEAHTTFGNIGVRTWIYRGDVLPEAVPRATKPETAPASIAPKEHKGWRRVGVVRREDGEVAAEGAGEEVVPAVDSQTVENELKAEETVPADEKPETSGGAS
jgi:small subunit ribosomal protein S3